MLVTLPKRYDQVATNQPIVDAIKAKKEDPTGHLCGQLMLLSKV